MIHQSFAHYLSILFAVALQVSPAMARSLPQATVDFSSASDWHSPGWAGNAEVNGASGTISVALPHGDEPVTMRSRGEGDRTIIEVVSRSDLATFNTVVVAYTKPAGLIHWTVDADWTRPHALSPGMPECTYASVPARTLENQSRPVRVLSAHRFGQTGFETGQAFLPADAALGGTALYILGSTAPTTLSGLEQPNGNNATVDIVSQIQAFCR